MEFPLEPRRLRRLARECCWCLASKSEPPYPFRGVLAVDVRLHSRLVV